MSNSAIETINMNKFATPSKFIEYKSMDYRKFALFIFLVLEVIFFSTASPYFLKVNNLFNIATAASLIGIVCVGMTIVMIGGGFDLSIGSVMAASGVIAAMTYKSTGSFALSLLASIATGLVVGGINGFCITRLRINALITTLATMGIVRGVAYIISHGTTVLISDDTWTMLGQGKIGPLPVLSILLVVFFVAGWWIMKYTQFGRYVYAIGGNDKSCYLSGINVKGWRTMQYTACGALAGFAGLLLSSQAGASFPTAALGFELDAVSATVLGGVSLAGGIGTMTGTFLGVLIIGVLKNGMLQLDIPIYWQMVAQGLVLLTAVGIDQFRRGSDL